MIFTSNDVVWINLIRCPSAESPASLTSDPPPGPVGIQLPSLDFIFCLLTLTVSLRCASCSILHADLALMARCGRKQV